MNYGRFEGDGRERVKVLKSTAFSNKTVSKSNARRIIRDFLESRTVFSKTNFSTTICKMYCDDVNIPYKEETGNVMGDNVYKLSLL